jgi:hypothetical protein
MALIFFLALPFQVFISLYARSYILAVIGVGRPINPFSILSSLQNEDQIYMCSNQQSKPRQS